MIEIRTANYQDLEAIYFVESVCFPKNEAATKEELADRLKMYSRHFLLLYVDGKLVSFIDGMVTNKAVLTDEMYEDASMHNVHGDYQMIFGLNTLPEYRKNGYAGMLMNKMIELARSESRLGVILTCKEQLIPYYTKFGFINEGKSVSTHGGETWYQMKLLF